MIFINAQQAFEFYFYRILNIGHVHSNTKALFNQSFIIRDPLDNNINTSWRKWNKLYAEYEWQWYLSGNPSVEEIKKKAKMWDLMHNGDNIVNSNYGFQWKRSNQLQSIIDKIKEDKYTRQAVISIYDGKEHDKYKFDTPCTLAIHFQYFDNSLNMTVVMRSNDLWFGFCNDQYCFSKLLELVCKETKLNIGTYTHFVSNLHLYERHFSVLNEK